MTHKQINFIPVTILTEYDIPNPEYDEIEGDGEFITNGKEKTIVKKIETKGFLDFDTIVKFKECFDIDDNKVIGTWVYSTKGAAVFQTLIKEDIELSLIHI